MTETARNRTRTVEHPEDRNIDKCTCFVRRVPKDVGENELLEVFGAIGPVKKAFLVRDKDQEHHKGYAFVTFALADDAKKAVRELANHTLHGSKLKVEPAQRRVPLAERHEGGDTQNDQDDAEATGVTGKHRRGTMTATQKAELCKAVAIGGMSSHQIEAVVAKAKGLGSVTSVDGEVPVVVASIAKLKQDGCPDGAILVHYSSVKEAMEAVVQLHRLKLKVAGQSVVLWARQVNGEGANVKQWRLIIRNLPFSVDEPELIKFVGQAAMVWGASIPKDSSGKKKGFGFVSFTCRAHAVKAMAHVNAKKLKGRVLVADWSIPKNEFSTAISGPDADGPPLQATAAVSTDPADAQKVADAPEASTEDSEGESDGEENAMPGNAHGLSCKPSIEGGAPDSSMDAESDDPETLSYAALHVKPGERRMYEAMLANVLSEKGTADKTAKKSSQSKGKATLPDDGLAEAKIGKQTDGKKTKKHDKAKTPEWEGGRSEAVAGESDGGSGLIQRQVFVRNLSLDVLSSELSACMQKFGEVKACRLVLNKSTGKPKGTAFVEFQEAKAADAACKSCAMEREGSGEGVRLRGRVLAVDAALVQDKARSLAFQMGSKGGQASSGTGKRNLHLVKEGRIEHGSELWNQLSERDQRKRLNSIKEVNLKLKSSNFFISPTRLRIMNVPIAWDDSQLKACCMKAIRERATHANPTVAQCVILRDAEKKDAKGQAKSRGCAFVEFDSHEDALVCLRQMNNNPALFGGKPARPIVEFAVENVRALKIQQKKRKAVEDMKQQRSMAELAPGEDAAGKKKSKKRKHNDKIRHQDAASGPPDQGATENVQKQKRARKGNTQEEDLTTLKKGATDKQTSISKHADEHEVPMKDAQAKQKPHASHKRPNKRTPANADDLDRALSKRAKQLFNGISL